MWGHHDRFHALRRAVRLTLEGKPLDQKLLSAIHPSCTKPPMDMTAARRMSESIHRRWMWQVWQMMWCAALCVREINEYMGAEVSFWLGNPPHNPYMLYTLDVDGIVKSTAAAPTEMCYNPGPEIDSNYKFFNFAVWDVARNLARHSGFIFLLQDSLEGEASNNPFRRLVLVVNSYTVLTEVPDILRNAWRTTPTNFKGMTLAPLKSFLTGDDSLLGRHFLTVFFLVFLFHTQVNSHNMESCGGFQLTAEQWQDEWRGVLAYCSSRDNSTDDQGKTQYTCPVF